MSVIPQGGVFAYLADYESTSEMSTSKELWLECKTIQTSFICFLQKWVIQNIKRRTLGLKGVIQVIKMQKGQTGKRTLVHDSKKEASGPLVFTFYIPTPILVTFLHPYMVIRQNIFQSLHNTTDISWFVTLQDGVWNVDS